MVLQRSVRRNARQGAYIILVAVGLVVFLGFAALVTDSGYGFAQRQRIQSVLDTASLTTLMNLDPRSGTLQADATQSVNEIVQSNGLNPADIQQVVFTSQGTAPNTSVNLLVEANVSVRTFLGALFGVSRFSVAVSTLTTAKLTENPTNDPNDGFGIYGCSELQFEASATSQVLVDAYDSRLGPYQGPPANPTGTAAHIPGTDPIWDTYRKCLNGTNCSNRVLIGSRGVINADYFLLYGSIYTESPINLGNKGSYVDKNILCTATATTCSPGNAIVGGAVKTNVDPIPQGCLPSEVFPSACFLDADNNGWSDLRDWALDPAACNNTCEVNGFLYKIGTNKFCDKFAADNVGPGLCSGAPACAWQPGPSFVVNGSPTQDNVITLEAGHIYYFDEFNFDAPGWASNTTIQITGDITANGYPIIFADRNFQIDAKDTPLDPFTTTFTAATASCGPGGPGNCPLHIPGLGIYGGTGSSGEIELEQSFTSNISIDILAPTMEVEIEPNAGGANFYGRVIANTVELEGKVAFHFDSSLAPSLSMPPSVPPAFRNVRLVR